MSAEATKQQLGECSDLESIAAYLDGRLSIREREQMAAHLADCDDCAFIFSEAAQTRVTANIEHDGVVSRWWQWIARPVVWWPAAAAIAMAAVVMVTGASVLFMRRATSTELQALVSAVGTDRTVEPRLTGGFAYAPVRGVVRGPDTRVPTASPDVRIAAAVLEKKAVARRTPTALDSLGIAYLVVGDIERAVQVLEEAAERARPNAQVLSNLSAAYLVRGRQNNQPQDFPKALAMADRAVKANPTLAEASFNRALALECLSLADQALGAWRDYLTIDDRSAWADEARSHLHRLDAMRGHNSIPAATPR